jgi:hypothetical protein
MGKGSKTTTTTMQQNYDPVSSRKMADIAGRQQDIAEDQWKMYKDYFQEYEIKAAEANVELLPYVTEASKLTLEEQKRDMERNRAVKDALREEQLTELGMAKPVAEKFYKESLEGVDLGKRADVAGANVLSAVRAGRGAEGRELTRYGIDPSSSRFKSGLSERGISTAMLVGGARNRAVEEGERESYARLGTALGVRGRASGLPGIQTTQGQGQTAFGGADPAGRALGAFGGAAGTYAPLASRVLSSTGTKTEPRADFWDFAGNVLGQAAGAYVGGKMAT